MKRGGRGSGHADGDSSGRATAPVRDSPGTIATPKLAAAKSAARWWSCTIGDEKGEIHGPEHCFRIRVLETELAKELRKHRSCERGMQEEAQLANDWKARAEKAEADVERLKDWLGSIPAIAQAKGWDIDEDPDERTEDC